MSRPAALPTVQIDNDRLRVTEWRFPPGTATGWHRHEYDYTVVPITTGNLTIESKTGTALAPLATGKPYFREAGVEHDVINANDFEFVFIEVELKERG
jgi:quercetin dioxygenase-like cupin family protein